MTLLLQCLRDVRTMSGDIDLLPPPGRGDSLDVHRLVMPGVDRDAPRLLARKPTALASGAAPELMSVIDQELH